MPSLWTDDDSGAHPWLAGCALPASPTTSAPDEPASAPRRFARPALLAVAATTAAALAAALLGALG